MQICEAQDSACYWQLISNFICCRLSRCRVPAGCEALFVHILWVNTKARQFYEAQDFYIDLEESANTAHYRGHCLEGIEGRGRTILLRYDLNERERRPGKHRIV